MKLLLGSANQPVIDRWRNLLADKYELLQATTLRQVKKTCSEQTIDLLLLHRSLVDMESAAEFLLGNSSPRTFLLSDRPNDEEGLAFLRQGIVGYANTYMAAARLTEAVRIVSSGAVWMGQKVMQRLIREMATPKTKAAESLQILQKLSNRESEIAEMVGQGQTNLEIAANLDITERTVKAHLSSIYAKTGTGNRLNLALLINRGT